jgi:hypothetical protein
MVLIATKILMPLYSIKPFMSYNRLKILKGWVSILRKIQESDSNIFEVFKTTEEISGHVFTLKEILYTIFEIYSIWYQNLKNSQFRGLF